MIIGERNHHFNTVHVPPWPLLDDPTALHGYLPSHDPDSDSDESDHPVDAYSCDHFRMFEFKVRMCARGRSHDWTDCPYAHPGEKARRRDPRKFHYSGTSCPDFRKGNCRKGDACEHAHGVFECWLHPSRYRTQPCKDGTHCLRRVCFFAHSPEQLRVLSPRTPGTGSPPSESPPLSPMTNSLSRSPGSNSVSEMVASLRQLQLNKVNSIPCSWGFQIGVSGFESPTMAMARTGFFSLPSTPTRVVTRPGIGSQVMMEPVMERVESGRDLRAKMFEKLSRENPLDLGDPKPPSPGPDFGWISELVK
ncbi:zinc finger CCCH domain-containing protein 20-like [Actinidia eriantha]|uniref:zinc finger CCCH domain-containing protein 20-like n=1 Tax=Actinidia eriantha TaxID=165200 RepID=UPI00258E253C|nr:zinc finger CCCH domain-containing protein 20-like [Actinidia eriantha]